MDRSQAPGGGARPNLSVSCGRGKNYVLPRKSGTNVRAFGEVHAWNQTARSWRMETLDTLSQAPVALPIGAEGGRGGGGGWGGELINS